MEFSEWTHFNQRDSGLYGGSVNSCLIVNHLLMFRQWLKIGMLHATLDAGVLYQCSFAKISFQIRNVMEWSTNCHNGDPRYLPRQHR